MSWSWRSGTPGKRWHPPAEGGSHLFTLRLGLARLLLACLATCRAFATASAQSGKWPTRPIRLGVPYPPGTGADIMARDDLPISTSCAPLARAGTPA